MTMAPLLLLFAASFDAYLATPFPPADGFDAPRPGIVTAAAHGLVVEIGEGSVVLEHVAYENHEKHVVRSRYEKLTTIAVKRGAIVSRGQKIGEGDVRFTIDRALPKKLFVPQREPVLVLVDQAQRKMALYEKGELVREVEVGFGQRPGRKRRQGDLRTPKGMYFVVSKSRGPFDGPYGAYYGGHWIKINYPNAYDAEWGLANDLIDRDVLESVRAEWSARRLTNQRTALGGGIGFHGWPGEWSWDETGWLSWGCVVLHNEDVRTLYDRIPTGAMVVLF